jgi:hypothetical protein
VAAAAVAAAAVAAAAATAAARPTVAAKQLPKSPGPLTATFSGQFSCPIEVDVAALQRLGAGLFQARCFAQLQHSFNRCPCDISEEAWDVVCVTVELVLCCAVNCILDAPCS